MVKKAVKIKEVKQLSDSYFRCMSCNKVTPKIVKRYWPTIESITDGCAGVFICASCFGGLIKDLTKENKEVFGD